MNKDNRGAEGKRVVAFFHDEDEVRQVWLREEETGGIEVGETTSGPLTKEVYGEERHDHRVRLGAAELECVARAMGEGATGAKALGAFLSSEDVFLSDLMDALDQREISYDYVSIMRRGTAFRPRVQAL